MSEIVNKPKGELGIVRIASRAENVAEAMATVARKIQDATNLAVGVTTESSEAKDKPARVGAYGEIEDSLDSIRESGAVIEACAARL